MATFYALPSLTSLNGPGWSLASGGAPTSGAPGSADYVVFDANSGPSRAISGGGGGRTIRGFSTAGANPMTFTAPGTLSIISSLVDLTGTINCGLDLYFYGACSLRSGACPIANVKVINYSGYSLQILDDLVCLGVLKVEENTSSDGDSVVTVLNGANVTTPSILLEEASTLLMGSGTWTLTADSGSLIAGTGTVETNLSPTIKATGGGATTKSIGRALNGASIWNATTGSGGLTLLVSSNLNKFKVSGGSKTLLQQGSIMIAAVFEVDGAGALATIQSTSSTRASIDRTGSGPINFRYAQIQDINFVPANTFFGSQCKDLGNNLGFTFRLGAPSFFPFF